MAGKWHKKTNRAHESEGARKGGAKLLDETVEVMKKGGEIQKAKPVKTAVAAGAHLDLTSTCAHDKAISDLVGISDDHAFCVAAKQQFQFFGRMNVTTAVTMGRILLAVKSRMPGEFGEWLADVDFAERTARKYMAFAYHAGTILESKPLQRIGVERLATLTALPDEEFDEIAKKGKLDEMSLEEFGALPPSQARKIVAERNRLKEKLEAANDQIETGTEQLKQKDARIRELEAGADEVAEGDDSYVAEVAKLRATLKRAIDWFYEHPPKTTRQMRELFNFSFFESDAIESFIYDAKLKSALSKEVREALDRAIKHRFHDSDSEEDAHVLSMSQTVPAGKSGVRG